MSNKLKWKTLQEYYRNPPFNPILRTKFTENKYKIFKFFLNKIYKTKIYIILY